MEEAARLWQRHHVTHAQYSTVEALYVVICRSWHFLKGWVTLSANFRRKGALPTNCCWCQKTRVIALSCGIKISAVHHWVLSQSTHMTDRRINRQNYDSIYRANIAARVVKTKHCKTVKIVNIPTKSFSSRSSGSFGSCD